jgi:hypothetical protein
LHAKNPCFTRTSEKQVKDYSHQNAQFFEDDRQVQGESTESALPVDTPYLLTRLCNPIAGNGHTFLHGEIVFQTDIAKVSKESLFPIFGISFAIIFLVYLRSTIQYRRSNNLLFESASCMEKKLHGSDEPLLKTVGCFESAWAAAISSCVYVLAPTTYFWASISILAQSLVSVLSTESIDGLAYDSARTLMCGICRRTYNSKL